MLGRARHPRVYIISGKRRLAVVFAERHSIHLLIRFDLNSNVGGACGEIAVYKGPVWRELANPLGQNKFFLFPQPR